MRVFLNSNIIFFRIKISLLIFMTLFKQVLPIASIEVSNEWHQKRKILQYLRKIRVGALESASGQTCKINNFTFRIRKKSGSIWLLCIFLLFFGPSILLSHLREILENGEQKKSALTQFSQYRILLWWFNFFINIYLEEA